MYVPVGGKVSLTCFAFNEPLWFFQTLTSEPISQSLFYDIFNVRQEDEGDYYCVGKSVDMTYFVAKVRVIIDSKYTLINIDKYFCPQII